MRHKIIMCIILLTVVLIIINIHYTSHIESFVSRHDKAVAIVNWINKHPHGSYEQYKQSFNKPTPSITNSPTSNIVEYDDAMNLSAAGKLTINNLSALL